MRCAKVLDVIKTKANLLRPAHSLEVFHDPVQKRNPNVRFKGTSGSNLDSKGAGRKIGSITAPKQRVGLNNIQCE